jgi:hypothetical protein
MHNQHMKSNFKRPFAQYVKKAHKPLQLAIEDEVDVVCGDPEIGELKVGDLAGIRVHKFRFSRQEYLIAYRPPMEDVPMEFLIIDFYQVGVHENFYAELKHYYDRKNLKEPLNEPRTDCTRSLL